jgi:formylglycine-generating enzyme required for sulfatase activity
MIQPNELKLGDTRIDSKGVPQVYVPAGRFLMGSTQAQVDAAFEESKLYYPDAQLIWFSREFPPHEVHITHGFWLDQYHVTNAYFQTFVEDGGYRDDQWWTPDGLKWRHSNNVKAPQDYKNFIENPMQPRVGITWHEAEAYANWRGGRLPTEAEWEYAARGERSLVFPWGNDYDQQKLNSHRLIGKTTPVDAYPDSRSWCGAFDMAGNIWDWCADWSNYDFYAQCVKNNIINDPVCTIPSENRILRGGAWSFTPVTCRATFRYENLAYPSNAWGCRLVSAATS